MSRLQSLYFHRLERDGLAVELELFSWGRDFLLTMGGGETHHGAVALGEEGQTHLITPGAHKEGPLAQKAVSCLSPLLPGELAVLAGIHYPNLSQEGIQAILDLVDQLIDLAMEFIRSDFPS